MGNDSVKQKTNFMPTAYSLSTYMVKVTTNGSNQPVLQVVTRSGETVMSTLNLSTQNGEIYTDENNNFYIVGTSTEEDQYVNTIDPCNNDIYLTTGADLEYINGSSIYLNYYNAYLKAEDGMVNFYEKEKEQSMRKAS